MKKKFARLALLVFTLAMMPLLQGCYDNGGITYAFTWLPADLQGIVIIGNGGSQTIPTGTSGYP